MANSINFKFLSFLKDIPQNLFDQKEPRYEKGVPCCVGAHIAHHLLKEDSHIEGIKAVLYKTGLNKMELELIFRGLGIRYPFGSGSWSRPVAEVIEDLMKVEKKPPLKKANLSDSAFMDDDLDHSDLREVVLSGSELCKSTFKKSDLRKAQLDDADLRWTVFDFANLQWANLKDSDLREAYFRFSDLRGANLYHNLLIDTDLEGAYIDSKYRDNIMDSDALNIEKINWV